MRARYIIGLEGSVDPTDRGLAYGDGLFETMSLRGGKVQRLALHLDRLRLGCKRLELPLPDQSELERQIGQAAAHIDHGHLKLILTRGTGPRGYAPPASPDPTVILLAESSTVIPATELTVAVLSQCLSENEKLAGIKHLNRLEQVLGRLELASLDADEGLMLSTSGVVISGINRNLFAVFGESLCTPSLNRAGVAGVMRRAVLEQCVELGLKVEVRDLLASELLAADELFMTNALVGIQTVSRLDEKVFASSVMASRLRPRLAELDLGSVDDA